MADACSHDMTNGCASSAVFRSRSKLGSAHVHSMLVNDLPALLAAAALRPLYTVAWQEFNPQALSNCLWALAGLRHSPSKSCLSVCASRMRETLSDHTCQVEHEGPSVTASGFGLHACLL